MTEDILLNSRQVAELLGCTEAALALWRRERRGPTYVRLGRLVRYRKSGVSSWIDSRTVLGETREAEERPASAA